MTTLSVDSYIAGQLRKVANESMQLSDIQRRHDSPAGPDQIDSFFDEVTSRARELARFLENPE